MGVMVIMIVWWYFRWSSYKKHDFNCCSFIRRKELDTLQLPWVDSDTNDARLAAIPSPTGFIWDEIHPGQGPPGWNAQRYWPWENVRLLLTFIPSRMRSVPDRAVVIMYKPQHLPPIQHLQPLGPPVANPLMMRPANVQRLMSYCCGSSRATSCPIGERLVGACCHCAAAICFTAVYPTNPEAFSSTHRRVRLLDRKNQPQMDSATIAEMSWTRKIVFNLHPIKNSLAFSVNNKMCVVDLSQMWVNIFLGHFFQMQKNGNFKNKTRLKELGSFKVPVKLSCRLQVEVLPDIRMGSKVIKCDLVQWLGTWRQLRWP